ncbi:MAG: 3-dehydroquinate synthase family protein, partial [Bdellovibrionales bacterium]
HALETAAGYNGTLLHGEGVSIGIVLAAELSAAMGLCSQDDVRRIEDHFSSVGLPTRVADIPHFSTTIDELIATMRKDKKVVSGTLTFILMNEIGDAFVSRDVPESTVRAVLKQALGGDRIDTPGVTAASSAVSFTTSALQGFRQGMKERWKSAFSSQS